MNEPSLRIFIHSQALTAFTSGTPMRGLIKALIKLKKEWQFFIEMPRGALPLHMLELINDCSSQNNIIFLKSTDRRKFSNLKHLIGINKHWVPNRKYDLYLSPGMPASFKTKKPVISFVADLSSINMPQSSSIKWHGNIIFRNLLNTAVNTNTRIAAISNFTKFELEQKFPKQKHNFLTLYNGIENFWFDNQYEKNTITSTLQNQSYWIWWGYISNRKNVHKLLMAYLAAHNEDNSLPKIIFIGKVAPDQRNCLEIIKNYPQHFKIFDFQEAYILKSIVKGSQGLVFPSIYEGFGLPVIEAYSQGLPVLYSNTTSLPEIGNKLGIEVDPLDINSICRGLLKLHQSKNKEEMIDARKKWAENFTYLKAAIKLSEIISELTAIK